MSKRIDSVFLLVNVDGKYYAGETDYHPQRGSQPTITDKVSEAQIFDTYDDAKSYRDIDPDATILGDFSIEEHCL